MKSNTAGYPVSFICSSVSQTAGQHILQSVCVCGNSVMSTHWHNNDFSAIHPHDVFPRILAQLCCSMSLHLYCIRRTITQRRGAAFAIQTAIIHHKSRYAWQYAAFQLEFQYKCNEDKKNLKRNEKQEIKRKSAKRLKRREWVKTASDTHTQRWHFPARSLPF